MAITAPKEHTAFIICPECATTQAATVERSYPWYNLVHTCCKCGYVIMESEWIEVESE